MLEMDMRAGYKLRGKSIISLLPSSVRMVVTGLCAFSLCLHALILFSLYLYQLHLAVLSLMVLGFRTGSPKIWHLGTLNILS